MRRDTRETNPTTTPTTTPEAPGPVELDLDQLRAVTGGTMRDDPHGAFDSGTAIT